MLVRKTLSLSDVQLDVEDSRGIFSGYASKWGGVDSYGDTILQGAFADTLKKALPKMFFNHEWTMPIGKWTVAKEDAVGLFVTGELTPELSQSEDVYAALKHGTLDGLSIGGYLKSGDYTETDTGRTIHKWSNLMEISPVVFPADSAARIDSASVKGGADLIAEIEAVESIKEFEYLLRNVAGLSKGAAKALTARAFVLYGLADARTREAKAMQDQIDRITRLVRV